MQHTRICRRRIATPLIYIPSFSFRFGKQKQTRKSSQSIAAMVRSPAVTLAVLAGLVCVICTASYGRFVGGRTEIANVKRNEEVQELGRFSVEEYNRNLRLWKEDELEFVEVVEAEEQVVSGIKYYLKISATQSGASGMFESVVVVKPWLHSKQLLNFAPSSQ